jgi:hypothetical protein
MKTKGLRSNQVVALAAALCIGGISISVVPSQTHDQLPLRQVADIPLPGKAVRFDYQTLDASHGRLYIAHMNADQLVVFDTKKREVVANLDGFPSVHGVRAVPELGKVYASATGEHKVAVVDMESLKTIAKAGPVNYPDVLPMRRGRSECSSLMNTGTRTLL